MHAAQPATGHHALRTNPRQQKLIDEVRRRGTISVEELAQILQVSAQTIRRDVSVLSDAGLLARYHGGVGLPASTTENLGHAQREAWNAEAKQRIAAAIASRVPNGCSLFLSIGTTTEAVARSLVRHRDLRVVTNNLNVATILADHAQFEVIVCGGLVRHRDRGLVGEPALDLIRQFRVDIGVIGISSIESDGTLRDFDFREVRVAQAIIEQSRSVWLAADHSKFTRRAMVEVGRLSQIDLLFTDAQPPEPLAAVLAEEGGSLVVC